MYTIEIYRLDVATSEFARIDQITTFQALAFYNARSDIGGLQFNLDIHDPKATVANLQRWRNQICVKRDGVPIWFGPITKISDEMRGIDGTISVQGSTYLAHLNARLTDKIQQYTDTEQTEIAWGLIDTVQSRDNGDLLISQGTLASSIERSNKYERAKVGESIVSLAKNIDGFDFSLDPQLDADDQVSGITFNTYYPIQGSVRNDIPALEVGVNMTSYGRVTATDLYNSGISEGAGTGSPIESILDFGGLQEAYTRREVFIPAKEVSVPSELSIRLNTFLTNQSVEGFEINVELMPNKTPTYDDLNLGDIINIKLGNSEMSEYSRLETQAIIDQIAVNVDQNGVERVVPKLIVLGA